MLNPTIWTAHVVTAGGYLPCHDFTGRSCAEAGAQVYSGARATGHGGLGVIPQRGCEVAGGGMHHPAL